MSHQYDIGPYDPCPCGSGKKYKFCCAAAAKVNRHGKYPVGTVAYYGPDDKITTKIAASVLLNEFSTPIMQRWVAEGVASDPKVAEQIKQFFAKHGVKSVATAEGNVGCPHEEGVDHSAGEDCPLCPFWAGKQGTARGDDDDSDEELGSGLDQDSQFEIAPSDSDEDYDEDEDEEFDFDATDARIGAILGDGDIYDSLDEMVRAYCDHLTTNLQFPCEVTGIEGFRWEESYMLGNFSQEEYEWRKSKWPSYQDRYLLLGLEADQPSAWMLFLEDIAAKVRRISDGKEFMLGLSELKTTDPDSPSRLLMDDYTYWLTNSL